MRIYNIKSNKSGTMQSIKLCAAKHEAIDYMVEWSNANRRSCFCYIDDANGLAKRATYFTHPVSNGDKFIVCQ